MSDVPEGWYPDPQPPVPGQPPQQRYWDGAAWTSHVAPGAMSQTAYPQQTSYAQPASYAQPGAYPQQAAYGQQPAYAQQAYGVPAVPATPDGQPLAGWWQRVGAAVIDWLILLPIWVIASIPFWGQLADAFGDYFDEVEAASRSGAATPSTAALQSDLAEVTLVVGLAAIVVGFAYSIGFLMWKQATPGKLALGLRVRLRERPGPMPFGTVAVRTLVARAGSLVGLIPLVGALGSLFSLLDVLWPLWDPHKQALHDKVAKTNVVRTR